MIDWDDNKGDWDRVDFKLDRSGAAAWAIFTAIVIALLLAAVWPKHEDAPTAQVKSAAPEGVTVYEPRPTHMPPSQLQSR